MTEIYKGEWNEDNRHGQGELTIQGVTREVVLKDDKIVEYLE